MRSRRHIAFQLAAWLVVGFTGWLVLEAPAQTSPPPDDWLARATVLAAAPLCAGGDGCAR